MTDVYIVSGTNRVEGIRKLLEKVDLTHLKGKRVAFKANFNSADPFPASTHYDTAKTLLQAIKAESPLMVSLLARSGMGNTIKVLEDLKIIDMCKDLGVLYKVLDDFKKEDYVHINREDDHWSRGYLYAKDFHDSDAIIQTCCLKTHQYGGHFTLSLKNSVGMVAKFDPDDNYNYMKELHSSPHQRHMIAEINTVYKPDFILLDAIDAFVSGGPASGEKVSPNVILLSKDRVAIDAVGVAILRHYGTTQNVMDGPVFEQQQLRRAAELGLGVGSPADVKLVNLDEESKSVVEFVKDEFSK